MTLSPQPELNSQPELKSRDDHHQPFSGEDQFLTHGVHSVKYIAKGFTILARDGWTYDSEQISLLHQQHADRFVNSPSIDETKASFHDSKQSGVDDCLTEDRLENYLINCFLAPWFGNNDRNPQIEKHLVICSKCADIVAVHDFFVDSLWEWAQEVHFPN